jgi:hypothetical protein
MSVNFFFIYYLFKDDVSAYVQTVWRVGVFVSNAVVKRRKWGPSKTQLSLFCIYCGDSDYMFRPCLAIFRWQCWRHTQMRNTQLYVHRRCILINEISLLQSVVACLISCGVEYCRKIWFAGVIAVFMNHTQESPGILQQLQQTIFYCNTPHRKK